MWGAGLAPTADRREHQRERFLDRQQPVGWRAGGPVPRARSTVDLAGRRRHVGMPAARIRALARGLRDARSPACEGVWPSDEPDSAVGSANGKRSVRKVS